MFFKLCVISKKSILLISDRIQPYHTILLSPDIVQDTSGEFPPDFSTAICALISAVCCSKPLYQIAADADLTLRHAMKIAAHLVYWDRAKVAYPICQSRVSIIITRGKDSGARNIEYFDLNSCVAMLIVKLFHCFLCLLFFFLVWEEKLILSVIFCLISYAT